MNTPGREIVAPESRPDAPLRASWQDAVSQALGPWEGFGGTNILERLVGTATLVTEPTAKAVAKLTGLDESVIAVALDSLTENGRLASRWDAVDQAAAEVAAYYREIEKAHGCESCGALRLHSCVAAKGYACAPHVGRVRAYEAGRGDSGGMAA